MQDFLRAFPDILKAIDSDGRSVEPFVFAAWKRVVEDAFAEHLVPLRLSGNRLYVAVASEVWRRQVADLGPALADKINAATGSALVKYIEFQVDPVPVREHRERIKALKKAEEDRAAAAKGQLTQGLIGAADFIADDGLREKFLAAAGSSLARRQKIQPDPVS